MIVELVVQVGPFAHAEYLRTCRRREVFWRKSETLIGCPFRVRRAQSCLHKSTLLPIAPALCLGSSNSLTRNYASAPAGKALSEPFDRSDQEEIHRFTLGS